MMWRNLSTPLDVDGSSNDGMSAESQRPQLELIDRVMLRGDTMRDKALTLSDGTKVLVSDHQISLLGPDESSAAKRIEHSRSVYAAVTMWAGRHTELTAEPARSSGYYRAVTKFQRHADVGSWATNTVNGQNSKTLVDPDIVCLRSWIDKTTGE